MKNITKFPQKIQELFRDQDQINLRTWQKELDFKQDIKRDLSNIIDHVSASEEWYRSQDIDTYAERINQDIDALDAKDVYFRNCFHAGIISKTYMQSELHKELRLQEHLKQKNPEDVLQRMYDQEIYLIHKSLHTLDKLDSDWTIRRVDKDDYNHKNVYYQEVDGAVIVHFSYRLINAIDTDTNVKKDIFEID